MVVVGLPMRLLTIFCNDRGDAMKWYYEWKLNKIRAKISGLEEETQVRLFDNYTAHSRLRVLNRIADSLQQRLAKYPGYSMRAESEEVRS